jgi:hypothetical protein
MLDETGGQKKKAAPFSQPELHKTNFKKGGKRDSYTFANGANSYLRCILGG